MSDPNDLGAFLGHAWQVLRRGAADAKHPARYPVVSTVSPDGWPEARTMALRAAKPSEALLEVHTDIDTFKIAALRACSRVEIHTWVPRSDLQVRAACTVEIVADARADDAWDRVPERSRVSYGTTPSPGTPIPSVHAYEKPPAREKFAVLWCRVQRFDLVELGEVHRRALYRAEDGFSGQWVAP